MLVELWMTGGFLEVMGKAYAHRTVVGERPEGDFYETPRSLIWVADGLIRTEFESRNPILDPCSGKGAISEELRRAGFSVVENDLFTGGVDYLAHSFPERFVITNPPFSLWDEFVKKAKKHCDKVLFIGRLNYFGTVSRLSNGLWNNLKSVHCFNRYIDYRTPSRQDGLFHVGAMATAWFLWDMSFSGSPTVHFLDVQKYAKLGNI